MIVTDLFYSNLWSYHGGSRISIVYDYLCLDTGCPILHNLKTLHPNSLNSFPSP